jgi:hypothetical protein
MDLGWDLWTKQRAEREIGSQYAFAERGLERFTVFAKHPTQKHR